jgi:hypothetical protein
MRGYEDARVILTSMSDPSLSVALHRASGGSGPRHPPHTTTGGGTQPPPPPATRHGGTSEVVDPWQ